MRYKTLLVLTALATACLWQVPASAQPEPPPAELEGWCCNEGKVFPAPGPECLEVQGQFFGDPVEAKANCVPEEEGWCCRNERLFPFAAAECHQLNGQFFANPEAAEQECAQIPPAEEGWCCFNGDVFPAPEPECHEIRGRFFKDEDVAVHECPMDQPPPGDGWCCRDENVFPAPEQVCHEDGGRFFDSPEVAEHECRPEDPHPGDGWCCRDENIFPAPEQACHEDGGRFFDNPDVAEHECRPEHPESGPGPHGGEPCACIYFEYIPKINNTDYWAGVSFTNVGGIPLESIVGHVFEADGSHWTVPLPALDVMNKKTMLFIDGDNGTAFYDNDSDLQHTVEPVGEAEDLGDMRNSMFIVGCGGQPGHVELDGYMMIGNTVSLENESYLARKRPTERCPMK